MRILYIDHYAGSINMGMEFRPFYLAREWEKSGHTVRIEAANFSHLRTHNPQVMKNGEIQNIEGLEYQFIKTCIYSGNGIKRIISMLQFCLKLGFSARRIAKEFSPDVVITSSTYPLDAIPGYLIAKKSNAKLVHEVHDMWPITPIELYGMSKLNPFVVIMQMAENFFCRHADKVVSVLPNAKDYFIDHGMREDKFVYVPNGIDLDSWNESEPLPMLHMNVINEGIAQGRMIIAFFGSHTRSYCLDTLLYAIKRCEQSKLLVLFVGEGNYKNELIQLAEKLEISRDAYAFLPAISKKQIPDLLKYVDISYIGAKKNRMFRFGIGMNKVFDAMMGKTALLYAVEAPNDFARSFDCGISVEAENEQALYESISKFLAMSKKDIEIMGQNGHDAVTKYFNYYALADVFIKSILCNEV